MTPERLAEIRAHNDKCADLIGKLASGHERWRMQIPANESQDSDLILIRLTAMVAELIDALTAERKRAEKAEAQCDALVKLLQKARKA